MSSLIEGYNYDIFISYRQKDNKYDGWVTEFVDNLKRELESMFKNEVTVYFDINPSDYLLETYDVDASLKGKLKCLVFIPIISRTYCDTKSFAWEYEFKAFISQASQDRFGLKVALPNGNITSRLLPVRINDLDPADIKLCESVSGGVFRGVDFIYKEPGVNRPLRSNEENPHDNLNHTTYRNQINKVALAIREIIESLKRTSNSTTGEYKEGHVQEAKEKKKPKVKEPVNEILKEPEATQKKERKGQLSKRSRYIIPVILTFTILVGAIIILMNHYSKVKRLKETAVLEIEQYINNGEIGNAFNLVKKADKFLSDDPRFRELSSLVSSDLTILTDPPGAEAYIREYTDTAGKWENLGRTPINSIQMPDRTFYLVKIEKPEYENVLAVMRTGQDTVSRKIFKKGEIPLGMVYVEGLGNDVRSYFLKEKHGFFIDKFEVTNRQFKEFLENGGYRNQEYWKNKFIKDGKELSWTEAMALFKDKTDRPGPASWSAGDYPDGNDEYPVTGISWYEAAAYAEYAGKSLPTAEHWLSAVGFYLPYISTTFGSKILPLSNFNGKGPDKVGKYLGISCFGAYDMAGNVREWCWNETSVGHIIRGGAWNDATYLHFDISQLPSFNRSEKNGFRCANYTDNDIIPESVFQLIKKIEGWEYYSGGRDFSKEKPVEDKIFEIYKNQFLFDRTALNAVIEEKDNTNEDCIIEKITFNAAYEKDRIIAYLFLPRNVSPPYQTIIYWPGLNAVWEDSLLKYNWQQSFDFLLKSGRAVMFPVYYRTFERKDGPLPTEGHRLTEWAIKDVKDFRRSIDFLETRPDIDTSKLGFYGASWGASSGPLTAVENRIKLNILIVGGFNGSLLPEVHAINYVSRVKIPTLMLNGRYDYRYNIDINVKPFFNLLGTAPEHKELKIYETDHYVPKSEEIKETLNWLDKYFGPAK